MNRAFKGAYNKGIKARKEGKSLKDNPYNLLDTQSKGGVTWSVAFYRYWENGWIKANNTIREDL